MLDIGLINMTNYYPICLVAFYFYKYLKLVTMDDFKHT